MEDDPRAKKAADQDKARERFAVYPGDGSSPSLTNSRSEAVELAHKTNGSWTRVSSDTTLADLTDTS